MQEHLKAQQKAFEGITASIPCLQFQLSVLACLDPGPDIASQIVLPALRERLETKASQFKAELAGQTMSAKGEVRAL